MSYQRLKILKLKRRFTKTHFVIATYINPQLMLVFSYKPIINGGG